MGYEEACSMSCPDECTTKAEDTKEQIDLKVVKVESEELNEAEEKDEYQTPHLFIPREQSFSDLRTGNDSSQNRTQAKKSFICPQTGQSFTLNGSLLYHMKIPKKKNSFTCHDCGKCFTHKGGFLSHLRIHDTEQPFVCPQCGKSFRCKGNLPFASASVLKRHLNFSHQQSKAGVRPHVCCECGKGFFNTSDLARHLTIHSGEKPYKCLRCGKSFNCQETLKVHERLHTGEKPYICGSCGKSFTHSSGLKTHKKNHCLEVLQ